MGHVLTEVPPMTPTSALNDVTLQVSGMSCASCVRRVEKALQAVPGVQQASVNLATEKASIQALPNVPVAVLTAALDKAGYPAVAVDSGTPPPPEPSGGLPAWWPVAAGATLSLPLMLPMPWLHFDDQPRDQLRAGAVQTSLPDSLEGFALKRWPTARRVEFCHGPQGVVQREGGAPLAVGCEPRAGDIVTALD